MKLLFAVLIYLSPFALLMTVLWYQWRAVKRQRARQAREWEKFNRQYTDFIKTQTPPKQ